MLSRKNNPVPAPSFAKVPVLVTDGWVRTSYDVIESLGRRGIPVHVVDRSKFAMCRYSRFTKSFHVVPNYYTEPEAYVLAVADVARKVGARVLIPGHEDIVTLAANLDALPPGIGFAHPGHGKLRTANNKWEVTKICNKLGVPCAESFIPESFEDLNAHAARLEYPAVIKTRMGNAGKGVAIVADKQELIARYSDIITKFSIPRDNWPMVQEYLGTDICGVCMIYEKGRLVASSAETYLRSKEANKFSTTTWRVSTYDPVSVENCRKVADLLEWHGVIHFDMIRDPKTGVGKITEINPRLWGTIMIAIAAGVDFPYMLYELALTGKISDPPQGYRDGVYSRWVLGELIGVLNLAKRKAPSSVKLRELREIVRAPFKGTTDDLRLSDPLPFLMEMFDYFRRYRETRSSNPAEEGMVG
jgi:predicted ATP-grasp superfamily ATP-dependent carboligase